MNFSESLSTSLVDIASIISKSKVLDFPEKLIDKLVNFILTSGGLINPIIVKRLNDGNFEVVEGDLEYFAFVKASKINSDIEMIRAIIITSEQENIIRQQAHILRKSENVIPLNKNLDTNPEFNFGVLESYFSRFKQDIKSELSNFNRELNVIQSKLDEIISRLPEPIISPKVISREKILEKINQMSDSDLITKLKLATISKEPRTKITNARQIHSQFDSFDQLKNLAKISNSIINKITSFTGW